MKMYPKVTFVVPTYNASKYLARCLNSIVKQNYPRDKLEIIVIDGNSEDNTVEIAKTFKVKIMNNPRRLAEYGLQVGIQATTGDLVVIFAADNELVSNDWLRRVCIPFIENEKIAAVWGKLISGEDDAPINKYFELIQNDPFSYFMNKNLEYYLKNSIIKDDYFIFNVEPKRPLVWGANGLTYRRKFIQKIWNRREYLGDNDAFQCMIEESNNLIAYIPSLFIYHHHVNSLFDWINKWKRNFIKHFLDKQETRNLNWVYANNFKLKLVCWLVYSLVFALSLADSIRKALIDKNKYWAFHPVVCIAQTLTYAYILVKEKKFKLIGKIFHDSQI